MQRSTLPVMFTLSDSLCT